MEVAGTTVAPRRRWGSTLQRWRGATWGGRCSRTMGGRGGQAGSAMLGRVRSRRCHRTTGARRSALPPAVGVGQVGDHPGLPAGTTKTSPSLTEQIGAGVDLGRAVRGARGGGRIWRGTAHGGGRRRGRARPRAPSWWRGTAREGRRGGARSWRDAKEVGAGARRGGGRSARSSSSCGDAELAREEVVDRTAG